MDGSPNTNNIMYTHQHFPWMNTSNISRLRRLSAAILSAGRSFAVFAIMAIACNALLSSPLPAQTAATGTVEGRVQNAVTGRYLHNARVRVVGTNRETFTNEEGEYSLPELPAGEVNLRVFYTGLAEQALTVSVPAGQSVRQEVSLQSAVRREGDVILLDAFVVASQRETNAATIAINEQRFSPNLKNVISTDSYGEINQGNIGEFVKHIPGVNIEFKDGNNASGIDIRGFGSNYTRVTTDGNSMAGAAIANTQTPNRQFVLEGASINNIARIEVTKEPLPDMPANSMGGSVNLVTKSAFEYPHAQETFSTFLTGNSYALGLNKRGGLTSGKSYTVVPNADATWVFPITKKLGLVASASSYDQVYVTKKNAPARTFTARGATVTNPYTQSFVASVSPNEVQNASASMKLDWKPAEGNILSLSASATATRQDSSTRSISYNVGNTQPVAWGQTYTHGATVTATSNQPTAAMGGGWQNRNALTRFVGANYHFIRDFWKIDLAATYSNSYNKVRDTDKGFFNSMSTSLIPFNTATKSTYTGGTLNIDGFDNGTMKVGSVTALTPAGAPIDTTQLANYALGQLGGQPATNYDTVTEYRADIRRDFDLGWFPLGFQVGGVTNRLVRDLRYSSPYWTYAGPDGVANSGDESMAGMVDTSYAGASPGSGLPGYQWASPWSVFNLLKSKPNYFTQTPGNLGDQIKNEATRSPLLMERVSAAYAMTEAKFFHNRLRIVGGVRYELTEDSGSGSKQDGDAIYVKGANGKPLPVYNSSGVVTGYQLLPQLVGKNTSGPEYNSLIYTKRGFYNARKYHDYFPSAATTFNISENFLARFAFAKTTGRPSPSDIVPNSSVSSNATFDPNNSSNYPGYITSSNTSLVPWTARNYDASLEYYLPHNGQVSVGVFRKDIQNFFGNLKSVADVPLLDSLGLSHDFVGYQYTTRINVGNARIDGLELGYSQQLDFIPGVGRFFNFYANATKLRVLGPYATQFSFKAGGGNIPMTGNIGLAFTKDRLSAHVEWNYRGKQFRDTSGNYPNALENVLAYQTWDVDAQYRLTKHFGFFVAVRNINNAINRWALQGPDAPNWATVENLYTNGAQYSFGIKGAF